MATLPTEAQVMLMRLTEIVTALEARIETLEDEKAKGDSKSERYLRYERHGDPAKGGL